MSQQQHYLAASKEKQIQTALRALQYDATLSQRRAAAIYNIPERTISYRRAEETSQPDCWPKSRNLDKLEGEVVVKHILELVTCGFPLSLAAVADMANSLCAECNLGQVGVDWPSTFVKQCPELTTKFNCKYNYKKALCKDSEIIQGWVGLVANIKAKYSIQDEDMSQLQQGWLHDGPDISWSGCYSFREVEMAKGSAARQQRVDNSYTGCQHNRVGYSILYHLQEPPSPLCLVQGGESAPGLGY
jgi:hypothetical protein